MTTPGLIAVVSVSIGGFAEDDCRLLLDRGPETDSVRLRHHELPDLDRTISLPATPGSQRDAAAAILYELVLKGLPVRGITGPGTLTVEEARRIHSDAAAARKARADAVRSASIDADRRTPSRILAAARTARLGPEPSAATEGQWYARCPGTNHSVMLSASTETFGCGYCKQKGGPGELLVFAARRTESRRIPTSSESARSADERTADEQL